MVISPNGRRMPLEEAVTLVSYLSGNDKGTSPPSTLRITQNPGEVSHPNCLIN